MIFPGATGESQSAPSAAISAPPASRTALALERSIDLGPVVSHPHSPHAVTFSFRSDAALISDP